MENPSVFDTAIIGTVSREPYVTDNFIALNIFIEIGSGENTAKEWVDAYIRGEALVQARSVKMGDVVLVRSAKPPRVKTFESKGETKYKNQYSCYDCLKIDYKTTPAKNGPADEDLVSASDDSGLPF